MKNLKKIAALMLTAVMAVNMAGCAMGGKLSPKKLAASAKKNGCELIKDADDFADMIEDGEDLEDGAYITVTGKDSKGVFKSNDILTDFYDSSIKSATIVAMCDDDHTYYAFLVCMSFASKKDATDYYEDMVDGAEDIEDTGYDVEFDDGEEKGITYTLAAANIGIANICEGIYLSGSNVYAVIGYGYGSVDDYEDCFEDIGGCYDVTLPSEL